MKRMTLLLMIATVPLLVVTLLHGCSNSTKSGKVRVVTSIYPIADVVRQVGGEHVEASSILAPGQSPHFFEPTNQHMKLLLDANLVVSIGGDLDPWMTRSAQTAQQHKIPLLTLADRQNTSTTAPSSAPAHDEDAHHDEHGHEEHGHAHHGDPHLWLDPVMMKSFTIAIANQLMELDPAHKADYIANRDAYLRQLDQLDAEYAQTLATVKNKHLVTLHEAYTYVARRYGLEYKALALPSGSGVTEAKRREVIAFIQEHKIKTIFLEPQMDDSVLRNIAELTNVQTARLDYIGGPNIGGYDSYLAMMRSNLRTLQKGMDQ